MRSTVVISQGADEYEAVYTGLELMPSVNKMTKWGKPFIKLCLPFKCPDNIRRIVGTTPATLKAVLTYLTQKSEVPQNRIYVGEGSGRAHYFEKMRRHFEIDPVLKDFPDVNLVDMNIGDRVQASVPHPILSSRNYYSIHGSIFGKELISMSKLKVHGFVTLTMGMKSTMGCMMPRVLMHEDLHRRLVDLNRVVTQTLTIIDGFYAGEWDGKLGDEGTGKVGGLGVKERKLGFVLIGNNVVSTDAVAAYLVGVNPENIGYLRNAKAVGLGEIDISEIDIITTGFVKNLDSLVVKDFSISEEWMPDEELEFQTKHPEFYIEAISGKGMGKWVTQRE